jgi:hypothetical protein
MMKMTSVPNYEHRLHLVAIFRSREVKFYEMPLSLKFVTIN